MVILSVFFSIFDHSAVISWTLDRGNKLGRGRNDLDKGSKGRSRNKSKKGTDRPTDRNSDSQVALPALKREEVADLKYI